MTKMSDDSLLAVQTGAEDTKATTEVSEFNARSMLVLAATAASLFCTAGFLNAFGTFQLYYSAHYLPQESAFQISWIGSFAIFLLFALGTPAGLLSDRYGPRLPISIGVVCQLVAVFMISLCERYYQFFLAQGVLLGIGMSFVTIPSSSVLPLYFQRNRGLAQGFSVSGSSLGGILWPIMLDQLLNYDGVSFGWTLRIVGFLQAPLLAVVVFGVRRPSSTGSNAKGSSMTDSRPEDEKRDNTDQRKNGLTRLKHPSFVLLCAGLAVFYFGFFAPFFYISTYATTLGISERFSIYLIAILNAASSFGRILPGLIADRIGHFNIMTISMFGSAIVCFCWTAVNSTAGLIVWALAYGFISGAVLSLQFACTSLVAAKEIMGVAFGIIMGSIALTALFGTPIAGELVKSGYLALSMFAGATMLVGAMIILAARLARNRNLLAKA